MNPDEVLGLWRTAPIVLRSLSIITILYSEICVAMNKKTKIIKCRGPRQEEKHCETSIVFAAYLKKRNLFSRDGPWYEVCIRGRWFIVEETRYGDDYFAFRSRCKLKVLRRELWFKKYNGIVV